MIGGATFAAALGPWTVAAPPCLLVAEIAQAHDGSLGTAHAYIDAVAAAGAHAVKFQTHIAHAESTPAEPWRVPFSVQDASRYDYWRRMEFTEEQWSGLRAHADARGLRFLSSAFSDEAVALLDRVGVSAWKVASGEVGNVALLERMLAAPRPMILSSGLSDYAELDAAVAHVRAAGLPLAVLQCTTAYPCPPERVGLNVLHELRTRYACAVGLSDHSATTHAGLAAAALGAEIVEVHVTFSRAAFGPDVRASLTLEELRHLADGLAFLAAAQSHPVDKDAAAATLASTRALFTRSVVARTDLAAGAVLTLGDLVAKKPGTGIPAERLPSLVGARLARRVRADELLREEHLDRATVHAGREG